MTQLTFKELIAFLHSKYPSSLAEDWDPIGLHFGHENHEVKKVMVALDIRPQVLEEALDHKVDTLVLHHPPIFNPIKRFNLADPQIKLYQGVIKAGLNVFAMHTNFDRARGGMNDLLTGHLGLESVKDFGSADPEFLGMGRWGSLQSPMPRSQLLAFLKDKLNRKVLTLIEKSPKDTYQTIAVVGGSGASFIEEVDQLEIDVFITGDITYHAAHDLYERSYLTIDASHYIEQIFISAVTQEINQQASKLSWPIEVLPSQVSTDPFDYYY